MRKPNLVPLLLPLLAFGLTAAEPAQKNAVADELKAAAGDTLTSEQKTALAAVDVRLAGVEALAAKIDDPGYRAEVASQVDDLKKRRLAIEKNFDPGLYEALMHAVISRYQVIALWLKPPPLIPIGVTAGEPAKKKVLADEAAAGSTLTSEQKTALSAVDVRLAGVEALAAKIDDPGYRAEVARQIEELKKRRLAIEKNFDPGLYEALMHSVISRYQVTALWLKPPPLPPRN